MDSTEQCKEKMAANQVAESAELESRDCELPMKPECCSVSGSSAFHGPAGNDRSKRSFLLHYNELGAHGFHGSVTSPVESGSLSLNTCSSSHGGPVVKESTLRSYTTTALALVSRSNVGEGMHTVQSQPQHLRQLAGACTHRDANGDFGSNEKDLMLSSRKDMQRTPFHVQDVKLSKKSNVNPGEAIPSFTDSYREIIPRYTMLSACTQSKNFTTSSFSEFFVKKSLKGKGIMSTTTEAPAEHDLIAVGQNNENQLFANRIPSETILNPTTKSQNSSNADICHYAPSHDGINLREWLEFGYHKINKAERMLLFRQIVQLVDSAHYQGVILLHLCPSQFILLPPNRVKYIGASGMAYQREVSAMYQEMNRKRPVKQELHAYNNLRGKLRRLGENMGSFRHQPQFTSKRGIITGGTDTSVGDQLGLAHVEQKSQNTSSYQCRSILRHQLSNSANAEVEEKWYDCKEPGERGILPSNIYSLGVLLFELLCCFESLEVHFAAMSELRHRILPPQFLSENPKEAGFCLWLLHPDPSSRPTTREILQSESICGLEELHSGVDLSSCLDHGDDMESELLLHFLHPLKEEKQKIASKLAEDIRCLESDIKEIERRHITSMSLYLNSDDIPDARKRRFHFENHTNSHDFPRLFSLSNVVDTWVMRNFSQFHNTYFSARSQSQLTETNATERPDKDLLRDRERWSRLQNENQEQSMETKPVDCLDSFFEGLCKFARYSKFEVCGRLRYGDLLDSTNVICSLSFDCDEDYLAAAAGVSKKIKIFEFAALLNNNVGIHYPVVEMANKSKVSCVCWNSYLRNYLASTDYDGVVQLWDAITGQVFAQYVEHQKRSWSVDFSQVHPKKFASGSDDCLVKLWSTNEFSAYSSYLLAFGSADYKIYCYDLRHTRIPWCRLAGHGKSVSHVKFLDSETLVSASTDNNLKLWDLKKTSLEELSSDACALTFAGHTNEKNFVGLSVFDGYISCGSETNEVYTYYRSLPMPITSHKFGSVNPVTGQETDDDNGQFVSSVCWRGKSNMVVAANSSGNMKVLQLV